MPRCGGVELNTRPMKDNEQLTQKLDALAACELNDHGLLQKDPLAYLWRINKNASERVHMLNRVVLLSEDFQLFPASIDKHHAFERGLCAHTAEVAFTCVGACRIGLGLDYEVMLTASIWHDFGKTKDYELVPATQMSPGEVKLPYWRKTDHCHKVRHLVESWAMFKHALAWNVQGPTEPSYVRAVEHCLLSHHGDRARGWGSAVDPMTREAHILHHADMISVVGIAGGRT